MGSLTHPGKFSIIGKSDRKETVYRDWLWGILRASSEPWVALGVLPQICCRVPWLQEVTIVHRPSCCCWVFLWTPQDAGNWLTIPIYLSVYWVPAAAFALCFLAFSMSWIVPSLKCTTNSSWPISYLPQWIDCTTFYDLKETKNEGSH